MAKSKLAPEYKKALKAEQKILKDDFAKAENKAAGGDKKAVEEMKKLGEKLQDIKRQLAQ